MTRFKLFFDSFFVYGLGAIASKIIPFLMLPLITRLMPSPEYFGLNDMTTVIISIGQAISVLGMYDAMYRMFFDKDDLKFKKEICSSAQGFVGCISLALFLFLVIFRNYFSLWFYGSSSYSYLIIIAAVSILIGSSNTIISAPSKMQNKKLLFVVTNTLSPLISYIIAIPLLLGGYYTIAMPLATVFSAFLISLIFFIFNRQWFSVKKIRWNYIRQMLYIGLPLFPNFILYWIYNSSDRMMIIHMLGTEQSGIYAIGAKLGQISQIFYSAFATGWLYYSYTTMKDDDQVLMMSHVFEYMGLITFTAGLFITLVSDWLFALIFPVSYQPGAAVSPYLFLAPLFLMLANVAQSQILIIKKTWISPTVLFAGVVVNLLINYILIPRIGIEGAAIGTLLSYGVSVAIYVLVLTKMKLLRISFKFGGCTVWFLIYFTGWRFFFRLHMPINIIAVLISMVFFAAFYFKELNYIILLIRRKKT